MKIRIQDNSVRFRLTIKETEMLRRTCRLESFTQVLAPQGPAGRFRYAVTLHEDLLESTLRLETLSIEFALCTADAQTLFAPDQEGVYLRREWQDAVGETHRFMAFVEKDRPGSTCIKPEQWIYDVRPGHPPLTIPIPPLVTPAHRKQAEKIRLLRGVACRTPDALSACSCPHARRPARAGHRLLLHLVQLVGAIFGEVEAALAGILRQDQFQPAARVGLHDSAHYREAEHVAAD